MRFGRGAIKIHLSPAAYVFAVLIIVSFSLLFFSTRNFSVSLKNTGLSFFSGVREGIHTVSSLVTRTILSIRELSDLKKEYDELVGRAARYEQLERSYAEIGQENTRLRDQLGFSQTLKYKHIPAEFIGRDPNNLYSSLVINKGQHSGVKVDMPVIAWQNGSMALVGKVIQAGFIESLVMPIYDTSCFVSSRLAVSRYEGIVGGGGSPDAPLVMRFIQKRAMDDIDYGDMVVSSGIGTIYPAGINIGRVRSMNYQNYEISMQVELDPVIDFSRLEYVFVIDTKTPVEGDN